MRPTPSLLSARSLRRTLQTRTKPTTTSPSQPHTLLNNNSTPRRTFHLPSLSSLTSGANSPFSAPPPRNLNATRTLPYAPGPLFRTISSVESYEKFLPFLSASTVTARDSVTGYPTRAFLTVGYGRFQETFTSKVDCDDADGKWVVEARSGREYDSETTTAKKEGDDGGEGLFEYLNTRWELFPVNAGGGAQGGQERGVSRLPTQTKVTLQIQFRFRSAIHATVMSAVEDRVAAMMIEAFEQRMKEVEGQ